MCFYLSITIRQPGRQSKPSCERKADCQKFSKSQVICTDPSKKKNDCRRESKCDKQRESSVTCGKILRERARKNRERCNSGRRKDSSQSDNKKCHKSGCSSGKRRYSHSSFLSNYSRDHAPYGSPISDVVRDTRASNMTRRSYASCDKGEMDGSKSNSLCEKPKETCETTETQKEVAKKCTKGPAKCLPKKSVPDKSQSCTSTQENKKPSDLPQSSSTCTREQYCASRKGSDAKKDQSSEQRESSIFFVFVILNP